MMEHTQRLTDTPSVLTGNPGKFKQPESITHLECIIKERIPSFLSLGKALPQNALLVSSETLWASSPATTAFRKGAGVDGRKRSLSP